MDCNTSYYLLSHYAGYLVYISFIPYSNPVRQVLWSSSYRRQGSAGRAQQAGLLFKLVLFDSKVYITIDSGDQEFA